MIYLYSIIIYLSGSVVTFFVAYKILCKDNKEIIGKSQIIESDHNILAVMTSFSWFGLACVGVGEIIKSTER